MRKLNFAAAAFSAVSLVASASGAFAQISDLEIKDPAVSCAPPKGNPNGPLVCTLNAAKLQTQKAKPSSVYPPNKMVTVYDQTAYPPSNQQSSGYNGTDEAGRPATITNGGKACVGQDSHVGSVSIVGNARVSVGTVGRCTPN